MKEEILERLVNELAAQNKLIALLIAREIGREKDNAILRNEDEIITLLSARMLKIIDAVNI